VNSLNKRGNASGTYEVRLSAYLAKSKEIFPYINQLAEETSFAIEGTPDDLISKIKDDNFAKRCKNKVRKCHVCSKAVAFTLPNCNSCGADLTKNEISYTNNVFMGFIYGIQKGPFPFTISIRTQTPDFLVFDDLLALCPCHLNVISTTKYLPDWRYLLKRPKEGIILVEGLFNITWSTVSKQFLSNNDWKNKILAPGKHSEDSLRGHIAAGFNYPPSQYQIHLQFMLPPFTPFHYQQYLNGLHFTPGRFFPVEYVMAVLELNLPYDVKEDTPVEDIIRFYHEKGISYEKIHGDCYNRYGNSHLELANYNPADFEGVIVGNKYYKFSGDGNLEETQEDIKAITEKDKSVLQNYGRPYQLGKPTGSYYKYAKKIEENIEVW
jgi:hypothetical protein